MKRIEPGKTVSVNVRVNGRSLAGFAESRTLLSDFLRHDLGATGTHVGCEHGVCGACTVRVDGEITRACLKLAVQVDGAAIETVEGLGDDAEGLSVLQQCFVEHHGLQCGFCTPGILMSLDSLFRREPDADEARIREVLSGHLCRCTGYTPIMKAATAARDKLRQRKTGGAT